MALAHRLAYELVIGPIPKGLQIDHLCRVKDCVNPAHLEAVTNGENRRRAYTATGWVYKQQPLRLPRTSERTHCPRNHPYDEQNTYRNPAGSRECRACRREAMRQHRAKARANR